VFSSFAAHDNVRSNIPDLDIPDSQSIPVDVALLIEETRINCMIGMLLCLDRQQRLVFILGAVMGASSEVAGDILEITPANFRQQLSRARQQLSNFMNERCGLINPENPCRCARKTKALVMGGYVNPHNLQFHSRHVEKAKAIVTRYAPSIDDVVELRSQTLFQEHPMLKSPDYVKSIQHILRRDEFQRMLNFN